MIVTVTSACVHKCINSYSFPCCVWSPSDVISARVQDAPAEPPLQVFSTGEDRGAEGSVRLYLQGLRGAEDQQETSKDTRGSRLLSILKKKEKLLVIVYI